MSLIKNDKNYRAMIIASSVWEGALAIILYISYIKQHSSIFWGVLVLFIIEIFSIGSKLTRYEKNHFNML